MNKYSKLFSLLLLFSIVFLASCGDDDDDDEAPLYTLTITGGTIDGGGTSGEFAAGEAVSIIADNPEDGKRFDTWSGDVSSLQLAGTFSENVVVMPTSNVSLSATYADLSTVTITVNGGIASQTSAIPGATVDVTADAAPAGMVFAQWMGDISSLDDIYAPATSLEVPEGGATIEAVFRTVVYGTWVIDEVYVDMDGTWESLSNSLIENFSVTFNLDTDYNPSTYKLDGTEGVDILPNFNTGNKEGVWGLNQIMDPSMLIFDIGSGAGSSQVMFMETPTEDMLQITWTVDSEIEGKPSFTYRMDLIPQ